MSGENIKAKEIKRLTTPLTFTDSKAYDREGKLIKCVETLSEVKYIMEPKEGILTDDEILRYAPDSKAAARIRLKRGFGNMEDVLLVHESLPWIFGLYYVILICFAIPMVHAKNTLVLIVLLVLFILPLIYSYYIYNLKSYTSKRKKPRPLPKNDAQKVTKQSEIPKETLNQVSSLKEYESEINDLKVLFDVKESVVRDLIAKRFEPPQITYDRFISMVDKSHKMFYGQVDSATNIINLASDDSPRIHDELKNKIRNMKTIIDQIEELTNELVINISSEKQSDEDVKILLDDMENLIGSVKEYGGEDD
jgi:hypothetical protein